MKKKMQRASALLVAGLCVLLACSKSKDGAPPAPPANSCTGVTVVLSATITHASAPGSSNGSITLSATGGSGFTYNLNSGAFSSTTVYSNLAAGNYSFTAKNSNGCTGTATFTVNNGDPCLGKTITVTAAGTGSDACSNTGSITVTATGGTGFTYSLNNRTYQASNTFNNVGVGAYIVSAKDGDGCIKSTNVTISISASAGPLFTAVRNLVQNNCVSCHNAGNANGGITWLTDCDVVNRKDRIKARVVDGNPSFMPQTGQLPQSEKDKVTAWINAGGRYTD